MGKTIGAVYEHGVFRPVEPVVVPEGEHVEVTLPELSGEEQQASAERD
jgi:predicted DNA-binding antitoxin AbrB/MazE fold protein